MSCCAASRRRSGAVRFVCATHTDARLRIHGRHLPDLRVSATAPAEVEISFLLQSLVALAPNGERSWEIFIFECPRCGPIFMTREKVSGEETSDDDRDSLVGAARNPPPTGNSSAIAVPEPDEEDDTQAR